MGFAVVIKTKTHFADAETHINRNRINLFNGWTTYVDSGSYDTRVFEFYFQGDINSTFSA